MTNYDPRIGEAPLPTSGELRRRRNIFTQFWIFVSTSWTMFWLAKRKH